MSDPLPLPDGRYDVFVVDAEETPAGLRLELTVVTGEHKGLVMTLDAPRSLGSDLDLLGMPATLTVADGRPGVVIDA